MGIVPNPQTRGKNYLGYENDPWEKVYASEINSVKAQAYSIAASRSWQPGKAYEEGDICFPSLDKGKSFMFLECSVAGTTSTTEPTWGEIGHSQEDGSAVWLLKKLGSGEGSGLPVGCTIQHLGMTPPKGFLALKGQQVGRNSYPELWDWVQNQSGLLISEANWQTAYNLNSGNSACYSDGDGATTFRLPNITGFLRPQGSSDRVVGDFQGDAIRNITGEMCARNVAGTVYYGLVPDSTLYTADTSGAFCAGNTKTTSANLQGNQSAASSLLFDASLIVPTAEENRPKSITVLYCVKAFDAIANTGMIDVTELADDVSNLANQVDDIPDLVQKATDEVVDFTIIYPNGGSKEAPATINNNNRYVEDNPFSGHMIVCQVELLCNGMWGQSGWVFSSVGYGVVVNHATPEDKIIIQTGSGGVIGRDGYNCGHSFVSLAGNLTSAPCRVKVWKVK